MIEAALLKELANPASALVDFRGAGAEQKLVQLDGAFSAQLDGGAGASAKQKLLESDGAKQKLIQPNDNSGAEQIESDGAKQNPIQSDVPPLSILYVEDNLEGQRAYALLGFLHEFYHALPDALRLSISQPLRPVLFSELGLGYGEDLRPFSDELKGYSKTLARLYGMPTLGGAKDAKSLDSPSAREEKSTGEQKEAKRGALAIMPMSLAPLPLPRASFLEGVSIEFGASYDKEALFASLIALGYEIASCIEVGGEVSLRNDILDVAIDDALAYRVSFFDDEVDSIRLLDVQTQRSDSHEYEHIYIPPSPFNLAPLVKGGLDSLDSLDGLEASALALASSLHLLVEQGSALAPLSLWLLGANSANTIDKQTLNTLLTRGAKSALEVINTLDAELGAAQLSLPLASLLKEENSGGEIHSSDIAALIPLHRDKEALVLSSSEAFLSTIASEYSSVHTYHCPMSLNLVYKNTIFLSNNARLRTHKLTSKKKTLRLNELEVGKCVVHEVYGVGRFMGIEEVAILGKRRNFCAISYRNDDKLLLPVENINLITPYVSTDALAPQLDALGKSSFSKLKEKVRTKLFAIANKIIELNAKRELIVGKSYTAKEGALEEFEKALPYALTPCQDTSIHEIAHDLASPYVMDRLLCGDVGFGKTEVALHAMHIVTGAKGQVLFIVPTTLLASQHFKTISERFTKLSVRKYDRTIRPKEQKQTLALFKEGKIDILIGTHGLLNVENENIGLIILDEEHKFGVKHKERIKEIALNTNILSMSATPIPRTLSQTLSHIKKISNLYTPPSLRVGVKTLIREGSDQTLKEAIMRELRRGGQVFYIFNNIAKIEGVRQRLLSLLPELKIEVLHSKVDAKRSEDIMLEFMSGEIDLLLSTSIVESGLHLPNANTIIIASPEAFGIADLHQLRGRVGRGSALGLCYLLVDDIRTLNEATTKRLLALQRYSALGSGFNLAEYDLELRGGGNLLGTKQSGHIKGIGLGLYISMLEDAIALLSGKDLEDTSMKEPFALNLSIEAFISHEFIGDDRQRLDMYARFSHAKSTEDIYALELEMQDRFGRIDATTKKYIALMSIKVLALALGMQAVHSYKQNITLVDKDGGKTSLKANYNDDEDILECIASHLRKEYAKAQRAQTLQKA